MLRVIGIGSPFGDDRIGWLLVDKLAQEPRLQAHSTQALELLACDRPGVSLLSYCSGADAIVLIDAVISGAAVGTMQRWEGDAIPQATRLMTSSHGVGLAQTLALGDVLGRLPARRILYGIEVVRVGAEPDAPLSAALNAAVPVLAQRLVEDVLDMLDAMRVNTVKR